MVLFCMNRGRKDFNPRGTPCKETVLVKWTISVSSSLEARLPLLMRVRRSFLLNVKCPAVLVSNIVHLRRPTQKRHHLLWDIRQHSWIWLIPCKRSHLLHNKKASCRNVLLSTWNFPRCEQVTLIWIGICSLGDLPQREKRDELPSREHIVSSKAFWQLPLTMPSYETWCSFYCRPGHRVKNRC